MRMGFDCSRAVSLVMIVMLVCVVVAVNCRIYLIANSFIPLISLHGLIDAYLE